MWRCHYGHDRLSEDVDLTSYDIVLSTYHTVMADWTTGKESSRSVLYSTCWKRIILDEGK